jgi:phosphoribosyl-AMP cyclohydrolase
MGNDHSKMVSKTQESSDSGYSSLSPSSSCSETASVAPTADHSETEGESSGSSFFLDEISRDSDDDHVLGLVTNNTDFLY